MKKCASERLTGELYSADWVADSASVQLAGSAVDSMSVHAGQRMYELAGMLLTCQ